MQTHLLLLIVVAVTTARPPTQSKFFAHYVLDRNSIILKRKVLLYRHELYTPWSNWGNCSRKDCTEFRYRQCVNESYEERIFNLFRSYSCPFQYIAETRRCLDDSKCKKDGPSELLMNLSRTCGSRSGQEPVMHKILGGREASPHSWPWQVALYVSPSLGARRSSPRIESPFCGATLIAPNWLVTAAHCLSELVPHKDLPVGSLFSMEEEAEQLITARIGDHIRGKRDTVHETSIKIDYSIMHPDYRRGFSEHGYDIALLKMERPVDFGRTISPICVPNKKMKLPEGHICYAAGWGETSAETHSLHQDGGFMDFLYGGFNGGYFPQPFGYLAAPYRRRRGPKQPRTLREVDLPLVSLNRCRKIFRNLREGVHVCAGRKDKDTCRGDSGGGLFCQNPADGRWYLYGVTSFGSGRGCGKHYGVYTCTRGVSDWIHENAQ